MVGCEAGPENPPAGSSASRPDRAPALGVRPKVLRDMGERKATPDAWTDQERSAMLDHLDRRRLGIEQAMWQAPAPTVAAQAFLLFVLADRSVDPLARGFILVAGIMASAAALLSPIRQRSREVLYSDAIAH
jgi:hypothetical protein